MIILTRVILQEHFKKLKRIEKLLLIKKENYLISI